jgi:aldehyde:ferredoxin oxidoreductase
MSGYNGMVLRVDLTAKKVTKEKLDLQLAKKFIGGRGLGTATLIRKYPQILKHLIPQTS